MTDSDEDFDIGMATIMSMGFDEDLARTALIQMNGNAEQALDAILSGTITVSAPKVTASPFVIPTVIPAKSSREKKTKPRKPVSPEHIPITELEPHDEEADLRLAIALSQESAPSAAKTTPEDIKYKLSEDKIRLTHSQEAQLQEAEKEWQEGDFEADDELSQLEKPDFDIRHCFEPEELAEKFRRIVRQVTELTEMPSTLATALLAYFFWNADKLSEAYFEDPDRVLGKANVCEGGKLLQQEGECLICGDETQLLGHSTCQHAFCEECWMEHLRIQITEGKSILVCMAPNCRTILNEELFYRLLPLELRDKQFKFLLNQFVSDSANMKWCPKENCGNAVYSDSKTAAVAGCKCGNRFCFACLRETHRPATCDQMVKWDKKSDEDALNADWIKTHTQDCPKCKSAIEKNGGCNHMTCRKCRHEFCWICGGNWSGHANCVRFDESNAEKQSQERSSLEKYLHYWTRFKAHQKSAEFEEQLRGKCLDVMMSLQKKLVGGATVDYMEKATEQLIECRRTLKYTYVWAYLTKPSPERTLFEYLQEDLDKSVERLSEQLEKPDGFLDRRTVVDLTLLANKKLYHLLRGVDEGLTTGATFARTGRPHAPKIDSVRKMLKERKKSKSTKSTKKRSSKPEKD